jgi:type II secretory pathway component PulJ
VTTVRERLRREEGGFTLTEMMVSIMIMIVVLFALYSVFDMSLRVFSFGNNKVEATESARVGLEKMEREIRQAYAFNRPSDMHLFDTWTPTQIRFGNDLDGNGVISCPNTSPTPQCEKIGYQVSGNTLGRDNISTGTTNTVSNLQPVAGHVQSLAFTYFDRDGSPAGSEATIDRVQVSLVVSVDQGVGNAGTQQLTSVIDLRNR